MKKFISLTILLLSIGTSASMERIYSALQRVYEVQLPTMSLRNLQLCIVFGGAAEMLIGAAEANDEMIYGGILMEAAGLSLLLFDQCLQKRDRRRLRVHFPERESNDSPV